MKTDESSDFETEIFGEILKTYGDRFLYRIYNDLFFDGDRVHGEFPSMADIPTTHHSVFRFYLPKYFSENSDKPKIEFVQELHGSLNRWLKCKHRVLNTGLNTARFIFCLEHGSTQENEIHLHLLTHIHPKVKDLVMGDVSDFFRELELNPPWGVATTKTTTVYDHLGIVSYFCKVEKDPTGKERGFKKFGFTKGFRTVIRKHLHKPLELPDPIPLVIVPFDRSDELQTPFCSKEGIPARNAGPSFKNGKVLEDKYLYDNPNPSCRSHCHSTLAIRPDGLHIASDSPAESPPSREEAQAPKVCTLRKTGFEQDPEKETGQPLHQHLPRNDWGHLVCFL